MSVKMTVRFKVDDDSPIANVPVTGFAADRAYKDVPKAKSDGDMLSHLKGELAKVVKKNMFAFRAGRSEENMKAYNVLADQKASQEISEDSRLKFTQIIVEADSGKRLWISLKEVQILDLSTTATEFTAKFAGTEKPEKSL